MTTLTTWQPDRGYTKGDVVRWMHNDPRATGNGGPGYIIRCNFTHWAGPAATDPWDPWWGKPLMQQLQLWEIQYDLMRGESTDRPRRKRKAE